MNEIMAYVLMSGGLAILAAIAYGFTPGAKKDKEISKLKHKNSKIEFKMESEIDLLEIKQEFLQKKIDNKISQSVEYQNLLRDNILLKERVSYIAQNEKLIREELTKAFGQNSDLISKIYNKYDNDTFRGNRDVSVGVVKND